MTTDWTARIKFKLSTVVLAILAVAGAALSVGSFAKGSIAADEGFSAHVESASAWRKEHEGDHDKWQALIHRLEVSAMRYEVQVELLTKFMDRRRRRGGSDGR